MAYEIENETFSLFKNDRKTNDTDADYTGSGKVGGVEFWANGWVNEAKSSGKKYLKVKLKPKVMDTKPKPMDRTFGDAIDDEIQF